MTPFLFPVCQALLGKSGQRSVPSKDGLHQPQKETGRTDAGHGLINSLDIHQKGEF